MDPTAATSHTATALQSALDAAYEERDALSQRLDEVDQLIADLSQASQSSAAATTRRGRSTRPTARQGATRKAAKKGTQRGAKKTAKKGAKKAAQKSAQRKATTKRAGKRTTRKRTAGGSQEMGRTDRVVKIIADAGRPLTTGDVRSELFAHEPGVTSKLVSASLSYAQRKGRIRKSNDGRWVPTSQAAEVTGAASSSSDGSSNSS